MATTITTTISWDVHENALGNWFSHYLETISWGREKNRTEASFRLKNELSKSIVRYLVFWSNILGSLFCCGVCKQRQADELVQSSDYDTRRRDHLIIAPPEIPKQLKNPVIKYALILIRLWFNYFAFSLSISGLTRRLPRFENTQNFDPFRAAAFVGAIAAIRSNEIRGPNPKFTLFCAGYKRQRRRRRRRRRSLAQGGGGGDIKDSPLLPATKRQQRRGMRFATYIFSKKFFFLKLFFGEIWWIYVLFVSDILSNPPRQTRIGRRRRGERVRGGEWGEGDFYCEVPRKSRRRRIRGRIRQVSLLLLSSFSRT